MYSGVARYSYRQHSCDDVTKLGLCDWFTNELTDWRRRRRRRKEITYWRIGRTSGPPIPKIIFSQDCNRYRWKLGYIVPKYRTVKR